jgi:hypothetical protein
MASPYKTFYVPKTAEFAVIELDFYEIDSWDASSDYAFVYVDNMKLSLGAFGQSVNEGLRESNLSNGITIRSNSLGASAHLGFNSRFGDQKHRVKIEIPKSTGLFSDGKFVLKLEAAVTHGRGDESGGWDNIKISHKSNCSP